MTFDADFRVTDATFLPDFGRDGLINSVYMGDYDQGSATNANFYFVWADNRLGGPDIRVQPVSIPAGGPIVNFSTPSGIASSASPIDITFDQPMDPASFSISDDVVAFMRNGADLSDQLIAFTWLNNNTTLEITDTSAAPGNYTLTLGPQILSAAGDVPMDNNFNNIPGESPGDDYSVNFTLPFPSVSSSTPSGHATPPVTSVTFNFTQAMDTSSFSLAQDVFSFTGTAGNLIPFITGFNWNTNQQLQINFTGQSLPGNYNLTLNPTILNTGGYPLDINGNGVGGEVPDDRYTASFSINGASAANSFGYRFAPTAFDPILSIQPGSPNVVTLTAVSGGGASGGDDDVTVLPLGTNTFNFYGTTYTGNQMNVSTNAPISFITAVSDYQNTNLQASPSGAVIAPFWDDLHAGRNVAPDDLVLYQFQDLNSDGTADQLVINWRNVHYYSGSSTSANGITFEAVLQINTGAVPGQMVFNYVDLDDGSGVGGANGQNFGASATVGIKNSGATPDSLVSSFNNAASAPVQGTAIRYFKNSPPVANANGPYTVAPGGTVQLSSAGSSDPDGDPLTYIWDLDGDGAFGETGWSPPTATRRAPRRSSARPDFRTALIR